MRALSLETIMTIEQNKLVMQSFVDFINTANPDLANDLLIQTRHFTPLVDLSP
jgi:hypothetical protein